MKKKPFEIVMFSHPTKSHLVYWLKEAEKHGIKGKKFEKLWFDAYNRMSARDAEDLIQANYYPLAGLCITKGQTPEIRNSGRKILNQGLIALFKKFELEGPPILLDLENEPTPQEPHE